MQTKKEVIIICFVLQIFGFGCTTHSSKKNLPFKALIIDGSSSHYVWPKTSLMMKDYLQLTGLFEVDIQRTDTIWTGIKYSQARPAPLHYYIHAYPIDSIKRIITTEKLKASNFKIDFFQYDLIISNLGGYSPSWPKETKKDFIDYIEKGGGFVLVHSANNLWGDWGTYNEIIGLGAWGERDSTNGPFVYYDKKGSLQMDYAAGICGSHGVEHEYLVTARHPEHPILKGLPKKWLHAQDELYDRMRGPFENATILATAHSDIDINKQPWEPVLPGTDQNVPVLMAITYGDGRIFHTTMGHFDYSMECIGFITTFQRGAEWAASGKVTQESPKDFPNAHKSNSRKWGGTKE